MADERSNASARSRPRMYAARRYGGGGANRLVVCFEWPAGISRHELHFAGKQASILYIMDLGGLRFDRRLPSMLTGALSAISAFMAEHYVELIHSFVLVNVPTFISAIW